MEPLDLTLAPPRSARAELDGLMLLPRTIDKLRGLLPGGNPGVYFINGQILGISGYMLMRLGVTQEELSHVVASAANDDEVAAWLRGKTDAGLYPEINGAVSHMKPKHAQDEAFVRELYKDTLAAHPHLEFLVDIIDADDAMLFSVPK
jgi:hypothetical protein